ncbi:MDR family MFS transporter [Kitasatospora sp. NPDC057015]|uniref:MDR family MFS transporter n=1 Tax=Kitasatospora sp. NPDC057015 TaxID=3346001 RepID=UPI00362C8C47
MIPGKPGRPALPGAVRGLPPVFWWIWSTLLVNWLGAFAGPMLAFSLTTGRGYSASTTGFVISMLGLGSMAGSFAGGILADRRGRRATMAAGHCWAAASTALLGLAEQQWLVTAAAFAVGLGTGAVRPAAGATIADVVPAGDRQRAFALNYWAVNAGLAVSAVLAGLMVGHGYLLLFLADAATTLVCAVVVLVKIPETRPAPTARPTGPGAEPSPLRRDRAFLLFVLLTLAFGAVFEQHGAALPVTMARQGQSPTLFSLLNGLNAALVVTLQIPLTRLVAGRSRAPVLLAAGVLLGGGLGLTAFAGSAAGYALSVTVWTLGEMLQAPAGSAVVAERAPAHQRGRYQGAYGTAWSAAAFLGPAGGGWVLDRWGAGWLWTLCAVLGTAAGAGCALVVGRDRSFRTAPAVREGSAEPLPDCPSESGRGAVSERNPT